MWLNSPAPPRLVARVAAQYGIAGDDAQDLAQETRIALWQAGAEASVGAAWVGRVAANKAVDFIRRKIRINDWLRTIACINEPRWEDPDLERLLMARIAELPLPIRQFHELHYKQGWCERGIPSRLGKCRASVRWLDHRCRRAVVSPVQLRGRGSDLLRPRYNQLPT